MKRLVLTGLVVLMVGCATTRPMLSESQYEEFAKMYSDVSSCGATGKMDSATAARGLSYLRAGLNQFSYYPARIEGHLEYYQKNNEQPTIEKCNNLAVKIQTRNQQIAIQNQVAREDQEAIDRAVNNRSKQTICNRIGNQTMCSTY